MKVESELSGFSPEEVAKINRMERSRIFSEFTASDFHIVCDPEISAVELSGELPSKRFSLRNISPPDIRRPFTY